MISSLKLDASKKSRIFKILEEKDPQIFIATTHESDILKIIDKAKIFRIEKGRIMRSKKREEKIDKILERFLKRKGFLKRMNEFKSRDLWLKTVGEDIASNTQPLEVRDGILFIKTANPILSNELLYLKKEIIGKINKEIRTKTIRDIYFKTGSQAEGI